MSEDLESAEAFWRYIAGRESLIVTARERLKNRRLFMVNALARAIAEESKTLERGGVTSEGLVELRPPGKVKLFSSKQARWIGNLLLLLAYTNPGTLRDLGEAICLALRDGGVDKVTDRAIALELVNAYEQCPALQPTLPEVREIFKARKKLGWPGDFYARRALRSLGLQLRPAKRGAPRKTKKN